MGFIAENKKGISPGFLTLLAGAGGVLFLALILYSHFSSRSFYTNYFPLYKELGSIERSIRKGYLWLEEATASNHEIVHKNLSLTIFSIPGRIDKVIGMREIRQIDINRDLVEGSIRSRLEELRKTTGDMAYLARRRLALAKKDETDHSLNSRFSNMYAKVISQINSINKIVENHFNMAISKADIAFDVVIGIWLMVVMGGMLTLFYFIRFRKSMEEDSERQLKLAKSISSAQECFIACDDYNVVFEPLIKEIVELTGNRIGAICITYGEADEYTAGIEIKALYETCLEGNSAMAAESIKDGISKSHMLKRTETTRQLVCAKPVDLAVLLTNLPRGIHTGYRATVIPFMKGTKVLGMLALAGEKSGMYGAKMEQYLLPLTKTCTNIIDSTLRERVNKELSENLDLAEKIFETSNEGVMITDREGSILFVNPAVYAITGFEAKEMVGRTPKVLRSDRHDENFFREMWTDMLEKGLWRGEIWNRRRDGQPFLAKTNITAVYSESGDIIRFISTFHDITDVKEGKEQIRFQALHDILTGLPNRRLFRDRLSQLITRAKQNEGELALFFVSLDRFKKVNENLGHATGDLLLQEVSGRITSIVAEGDTVGRWGGDEFLLALENAGKPAEADKYASKLISLFESPFEIDGKEIYVSVSIGIALFPVSVQETDQDALIRAADRAMSRAKMDHGNSVTIFNRLLDSADSEKMVLENELRKAVDREELIVYYQPKVRLADGRITGMEALSRWNHSAMGMISPGRFIPLAEETGLTLPIGENVLRDVVLQLGKWHEKGYTDLKVSINLSALQFSQADLPDRMLSILEPAGISPSSIDIEITEGMVIRNVEKAIETMRRLSNVGFTISVDDFGTGYSSLSYLKQFPLDTLKIDRSFVMDLPDDGDASAIVEAIISMAHSLGFDIVAEGVETEEQKEFLKSRGCEEMQGFLFSQPVPPEEFTKLLEENRKHLRS